jgi:hypothetical protein
MVKINFTSYRNLSSCPIWWRNFVLFTLSGIIYRDIEVRNLLLEKAIEKYHGKIIDNGSSENFDALVFDTKEDFDAFKIYWTLYGS